MRTASSLVALLILLTAVLSQPARSQGVSFIPHIGVSKDMRSETSNRWKLGLNVGGYLFISMPTGISIGGRVAYHSWQGDPDGWKEDYYGSGNSRMDKFEGSQSVIELIPTIRLSLTPPLSPVRFSIQGGGGLVLVNASEVTMGVSYSYPGVSGYEETTFSSESLTGFGGQLSMSVGIGPVEILPIYTLYLAGGDPYHHIAVGVGVAIP
jgi:hypothetical protein